jgi:hypothetical protein
MKKSKKESFMYYPEITDKDFYEKIYLKKEFRENEVLVVEPKKKDKYGSSNFELEPHQNFLKNYISPDTPYNGVLIYHGTGVGKTCTAISIAEGFKKTLRNINKKILVLLTLKDNFINGIYNEVREKHKKNPEDIVQCTGKEYELGEEYKHLTEAQKKKEILNKIKYYYEFRGYGSFANYVIQTTGGWKGEEDKITEQIKKFISKEFDDRVIIMDEIHTIKTGKKNDLTKNIQPILQSIIKYGKNIKLVLMSATPMFDRPDEIIFYMNLLLLNDKRQPIDKNDIFTIQGTLKPNIEDKLRDYFKGYISYIRSEKPETFPFRIYPKDACIPLFNKYMSGDVINPDKRLKYTKILLCDMENVQANTYLYHYFNDYKRVINKNPISKKRDKKKDGKKKHKSDSNNSNINSNINEIDDKNLLEENEIDEDDLNNGLINYEENKKGGIRYLSILSFISIIVFPVSNKNSPVKSNKKFTINSREISSVGTVDKYSIENTVDNGLGGYYKILKDQGTKKIPKYKYQSHAIFNKDTVNEAPFCDEKHLKHYSTKFHKILIEIKKAKGLMFIFSQFIENGTLPFALMLEQNGFTRECADGEEQLLDYPAKKLHVGGKRERICYLCGEIQSYKYHIPGAKDYHNFKPAKYILYFGETRDIIRVRKSEALKKFSSNDNKYGEEIKIFIGTRSVSEGLDFKRIRQVHIIEPWYNLSRHEQVIGRGIRRDSHIDLPLEERNCEIFQYASVIPPSFDKNISLNESIDLKNYRIAENKDIIIKKISRVMKESAVDCMFFRKTNIITDKTKVKQITASGQVMNIELSDKKYSTMCDYNEDCNFKCNWTPKPNLKYPINMDTYNIRFAKLDIENSIKYIKLLFRNNIIYTLNQIETFVLSKIPNINELFIYKALDIIANNKEEIIYDKFGRKGYIIYRGDYYVFQPFDLKRDNLPLSYRMYPMDVKKYSVNIDVDKIKNNDSLIKIYSSDSKNNELNTHSINKILSTISNKIISHSKILGNNNTDKKYYIYSVIGCIISKINNNNKKIFIKEVLIKYFKDSNIDIIKYIIEYLELENMIIEYYKHINPERKKKDKKNTDIYIGFIVNNEYYVLESVESNNSNNLSINKDNIVFVKASSDLVIKIKEYYDLYNKKRKIDLKYNKIYGMVDSKDLKFKILDNSIAVDGIVTKAGKISKRAIVKGRVCSTYDIDQLFKIRDQLGMSKYDKDSKSKKDFICDDIEIYLRFNNYLKKDGKIWFEYNIIKNNGN